MMIWGYDSDDSEQAGLADITATFHYMENPFAHAFIVALALAGRLDEVGCRECICP